MWVTGLIHDSLHMMIIVTVDCWYENDADKTYLKVKVRFKGTSDGGSGYRRRRWAGGHHQTHETSETHSFYPLGSDLRTRH